MESCNQTPNNFNDFSKDRSSYPLTNNLDLSSMTIKDVPVHLPSQLDPFSGHNHFQESIVENFQSTQHELFLQNRDQDLQFEIDMPNIRPENGNASDNQQPNPDLALGEKAQKLDQLLLSLAKFKLRRALFVSLTVFFESQLLYSIAVDNSVSIGLAFIPCYIFLAYYLFESIYNCFSRANIIKWRKLENIFDTVDTVILLIFLILVNLRLNNAEVPTKVTFLLPIINVFVYILKTKAPKNLRDSKMVIRILYAFQILLLAGKVDKDIDWPWQVILSCIWVPVIALGIYCAFVGITFICTIIMTFCNKKLYPNVSKATQVLGFMWITMYTGIGLTVFLGLLRVILAIDSLDINRGQYILLFSLTTAKYLSCLFCIFSLVSFSWVIQFQIAFSSERSEYKVYLGITTQVEEESQENKSMYFVKLSSTYFSSLDKSVYGASKERLNELREKVKQPRKKHITKVFQKNQLEENIESEKIEENIQKPKDKKKISLSPQLRSQMVLKEDDFNRVCLSEGCEPCAIEVKEEQNEQLCYICYIEAPDAVMYECGHGGVCADCAIKIIQSRGQCMQCRQETNRIAKIDLKPKYNDIVKIVQIISVNSEEKLKDKNQAEEQF